MVDIFQNRNYKYSKSKQYHKFFICTHRKRLLPFKARNGGIHTLSAPRLNILYCHGAAVSRFEIEKQVAFKMEPCRTYPTVAIYPTFFIWNVESVLCGSQPPIYGHNGCWWLSTNDTLKRLYGANISIHNHLPVVRPIWGLVPDIWLLPGISVLETPWFKAPCPIITSTPAADWMHQFWIVRFSDDTISCCPLVED